MSDKDHVSYADYTFGVLASDPQETLNEPSRIQIKRTKRPRGVAKTSGHVVEVPGSFDQHVLETYSNVIDSNVGGTKHEDQTQSVRAVVEFRIAVQTLRSSGLAKQLEDDRSGEER